MLVRAGDDVQAGDAVVDRIGAVAVVDGARRQRGLHGDAAIAVADQCEGELVDGEVGRVIFRLRHHELERGAVGDHFTVFCPVDEMISRCRGGGQRARVEVVVGTVTTDRTARRQIGDSRDFVAVQTEIRHQVPVFQHGERISGVGRHHRVLLGPVDECVAFVGRGRQVGHGIVIVNASTSHDTANTRTSRGGHLKLVDGEVDRDGGVFDDDKGLGINRSVVDHDPVAPTVDMVMLVGGG